MQSQLSLYFFFFFFGIFFLFVIWMAASPAFIMWTTPVWNGFSMRAERKSQDWITGLGKDLGLFGVTGSIVAPCLPCESDLWPAEGAIWPQTGFLCPLEPAVMRHAIQKLKTQGKGWTFTFLIPSRKNEMTWTQAATTWMNQPHQHVHCFIRSLLFFQTMKTGLAYHHTSNGTTPLTPRSQDPTSHQCYSLCWASWKHFLLQKKKEKKSFGGFCAVISNQ